MTSRPSTAVLAAALAVAALAAGCAPQTSTSSKSVAKLPADQRAVAQTIEDLRSAADNSDEAKICNQVLTRALAAQLARGGHGCAQVVNLAIKDTDSTGMTVEAVRITGNRAVARVKFETGKKDRRANIVLVREGGRWRIAGF
jgi:protein subunit release factor A